MGPARYSEAWAGAEGEDEAEGQGKPVRIQQEEGKCALQRKILSLHAMPYSNPGWVVP